MAELVHNQHQAANNGSILGQSIRERERERERERSRIQPLVSRAKGMMPSTSLSRVATKSDHSAGATGLCWLECLMMDPPCIHSV